MAAYSSSSTAGPGFSGHILYIANPGFQGDGARIIYRLSGTGTEGATLRVYLEAYESDPEKLGRETAVVMRALVGVAVGLGEIEGRTGREEPTVIT